MNKKGFTQTDLAMNGQQAVDMVEAKGNDHYRLILMDCEMVNTRLLLASPECCVVFSRFSMASALCEFCARVV